MRLKYQIKEWIFPRKPVTLWEERNKFRRELRITNFLVVFLVATIFTLLFFPVKISSNLSESVILGYPSHKNITIKYDNLTEQEIDFTKSIIKDIKPDYLAYQRSITFTKEIDKECKSLTKPFCVVHGYNDNLGNNYILFSRDEDTLRETLCHELLHTYFFPPSSRDPKGDPLHQIVYELGKKGVCYG